MRRDLPTGTVTFVFTDIEGSTRMLEELGADAYGELLARHHEACRAAWSGHGGVEVDTAGDAFFVAFPTASGALGAAADAQGVLAELGLRVRMGVHTGEVTVAETGYVGFEVHRAARIAAAAHGGQVVVSASTAALVAADGLVDLGEHRFKDLAAAERVYQLGAGAHPPLRSLYRSNLPAPATPFLGRERELAEVVALLRSEDVRLVTLTGPGGTGKTRLSLQAAAEASDGFPDGVFWVPLAPLDDSALVASTVAHALDVKEQPGRALVDVLCERLEGRRLLVLLDNAEHLLPELAATVSRLSGVAGPAVLITSRERLQLAGERTYPVPELSEADAVELFLARASDVGVGLERSAAVELLCVSLEQLPLALELAAARTVVFTPEQLLARLSQRLDLLKGGRDADPRQRTLRATIEWSYDLLDYAERSLFHRFAVFRGGARLEALEEVAGANADTLQSLVDRSLVRRREGRDGAPRYWMLETIRELAAELQANEDDTGELRRRHAEYYARFLAMLSAAIRHWDEEARAAALDELDNGRSALEWGTTHGHTEVVARILYGCWFLWLTGGYGKEATAAAEALLRLAPSPTDANTFFGALAAGEILRAAGERERALVIKHRMLAFVEEQPDLELFGVPVNRWTIGLITDVASLECETGDLESARRHAEDALALRRAAGSHFGIAHALCVMAQVSLYEGHPEAAAKEFEEANALYAVGNQMETLGVRVALAECRLLCGDIDAARDELRPVADAAARHDVFIAAELARIVSVIAACLARYSDSARLAGVHESTIERSGHAAGPWEQEILERCQVWVAAALGGTYAECVEAGRRLDLDGGIGLALDVLS